MSTNYSGLVCRWEGCGKVFVSYAELASHMLFVGSGTHISREGKYDVKCLAVTVDLISPYK